MKSPSRKFNRYEVPPSINRMIPVIETGGWTNDSKALEWILWAVRKVAPIMERRGWHTPVVKEIPHNHFLLGGNHMTHYYKKGITIPNSQKSVSEGIYLRIRTHADPAVWLCRHCVIDTMLHECTHFVHREHDKEFDKMLAELLEEYQRIHGRLLCNGRIT